MKKSPSRPNELILAGKYKQAISEIDKTLRKLPASDQIRHWYLSQKASAYYQLKNYKKALFYSQQAVEIAPNCPIALWEYAEALLHNQKLKEALSQYLKILKLGLKRMSYGQCSEGKKWALSIRSDCRFCIAECYYLLGNKAVCKKWFVLFKRYYVKGIITKDIVKLIYEKII